MARTELLNCVEYHLGAKGSVGVNVLLLSGLGPRFKNEAVLRGSLFDRAGAKHPVTPDGRRLTLGDLTVDGPSGPFRLLRPLRGSGSLSLSAHLPISDPAPPPHLTTFTLESILQTHDVAYEAFPLDSVWQARGEPQSTSVDVVLLSTTFIWERNSLGAAVRWIRDRWPNATLVVGGQYSNLKYEVILDSMPSVDFVVRGDGEEAIPALLAALAGRKDLDDVPNLVGRHPANGELVRTPLAYVDLEATPSPFFPMQTAVVPYESMRGCPFSCKFCSFPHASPQWRYKSAEKIASDWAHYAAENGAVHIRAMDSTFTVPPKRLRALLRLLPAVGVGWEAYSRANSIKSDEIVDSLASAHCRTLSIGFESMSDNTLGYMNKLVSSQDNRRAFRLLRDSPVGYRCSFMVGYPGETPDDYAETRDFLLNEYTGHFMLNVFLFQDETMPVWRDAERFGLRILDEEDPDLAWEHNGMDVNMAHDLLFDTVRRVRWESDEAVNLLWQADYQTPLIPWCSPRENYQLEKLVERLAFVRVDHAHSSARDETAVILDGFGSLGVSVTAPLAEADQPTIRTGF